MECTERTSSPPPPAPPASICISPSFDSTTAPHPPPQALTTGPPPLHLTPRLLPPGMPPHTPAVLTACLPRTIWLPQQQQLTARDECAPVSLPLPRLLVGFVFRRHGKHLQAKVNSMPRVLAPDPGHGRRHTYPPQQLPYPPQQLHALVKYRPTPPHALPPSSFSPVLPASIEPAPAASSGTALTRALTTWKSPSRRASPVQPAILQASSTWLTWAFEKESANSLLQARCRQWSKSSVPTLPKPSCAFMWRERPSPSWVFVCANSE